MLYIRKINGLKNEAIDVIWSCYNGLELVIPEAEIFV